VAKLRFTCDGGDAILDDIFADANLRFEEETLVGGTLKTFEEGGEGRLIFVVTNTQCLRHKDSITDSVSDSESDECSCWSKNLSLMY
jgi:hypothetical protein